MAVDWKKIKHEYITDITTSYRSLSKKYGVTRDQICNRSKAEGWIARRQQYFDETSTAMLEAKASQDVSNAVAIQRVASELVKKIGEAMATIDPEDVSKMNTCASALNKLSNIKDDADIREQQARIDKLRKEIDSDRTEQRIEVVLASAGPDDWNT